MRLRFYILSLFFLFVAFVSMSNRNGRAASQGMGNTGAPGDEMIAGAPRTCVNCHGGPTISASLSIHVLDSNGDTVNTYVPGKDYTARVNIIASGTGLSGYGFQMIALSDAGNVDLDGFSDPNTTNNYKIATISNGRTYAEHANISTPNTFDVLWKAPVAGTGNITFYTSGNGVNRNNGSSGDGAGNAVLKMTEKTNSVSAITLEPPAQNHISIAPNPVLSEASLSIAVLEAAQYQIEVVDLNGRPIWSSKEFLKAAQNTLPLPSADWSSGIYLVRVSNKRTSMTAKFLKN